MSAPTPPGSAEAVVVDLLQADADDRVRRILPTARRFTKAVHRRNRDAVTAILDRLHREGELGALAVVLAELVDVERLVIDPDAPHALLTPTPSTGRHVATARRHHTTALADTGVAS